MSNSPTTSSSNSGPSSIYDCWNRIGVSGDASCPELKKYVHCRNCPVYSAAAVQLLDREIPANYSDEWTRHVAQAKSSTEGATQSVVIFRIGSEWLGLPTSVFQEIVSIRPIHSLPHRRSGLVLGLANIRGELLICISLRQVLRLDEAVETKKEKSRSASARMLFIHHEGLRVVCPVDEVFGIQHFRPQDHMAVPATLAKSPATYTKAVLSWRQETIGLLDENLLFYSLNRGLV